jgi:hypothetical protein
MRTRHSDNQQIMTKTMSNCRLICFFIWCMAVLAVSTPARASQEALPQGGAGDLEKDESNLTRTPSAPPSPISFADGVLNGMRNSISFSLGTSHFYGQEETGVLSSRTSLNPRVFANFQGRRSRLSMNYAFGYQRETGGRKADNLQHLANLHFEKPLFRYASLTVSDTGSSVLNSFDFPVNSPVRTQFQPDFVEDVYTNSQRMIDNSFLVAMSFRTGRKGRITFSGGHNFRRYSGLALEDNHGLLAGIQGGYQISDQLTFDTSYTTNLTATNTTTRATEIHRLQVGGFKYKRRSSEVSLSGAVEFTGNQGNRQLGSGVQASLSKTFGLSQLSFVYNRGFSNTAGLGTVLAGDSVTSRFTWWPSRRVNVRTEGTYTRGSSAIAGSKLESVSGNASIEIAIHRHLLFSTQYWRLSQRVTNLPFTAPSLDRYFVSAGFEYFLPSLGRR